MKAWLEAQLALAAAGMVDVDQALMAFLQVDEAGRTLHEVHKEREAPELPGGCQLAQEGISAGRDPLLCSRDRAEPRHIEAMTTTSAPQQLDDSKAKALDAFLKAHTPKKARAGSAQDDPVRISTLADSTSIDVDVIPTGSLTLDHALGVGGFPRGRITELYGPTGGGKSTLALSAAKLCQDLGGVVGFIDAEQALNRELVEQIGIDPARFVLAQTDTGEQALELVENMTRSNVFDMIIIDSAAALIPKAEFEADFEQQQMGLQARLLSKFMRRVTGPVGRHNVALVVINQVRSNLGAYGAPDESTGGKALKYFSSVRVEVRTSASKQIKVGTDVVGTMVTATVKKNKFAAPFKKAEYTITFGRGIDAAGDVFAVGTSLGVIERAGNTYYVRQVGEDLEPTDVKLGVGQGNAKTALEENEELFAGVEAAVRASLRGAKPIPEPAEEGVAEAGPAPTVPAPTRANDEDDFFGLDS